MSTEILKSRIEGLKPEFREDRGAESVVPTGRRVLDIATADSGPGYDTDTLPVEHDLMSRSGLRFDADPERMLKRYFSHTPLLPVHASIPFRTMIGENLQVFSIELD